MEQAKDGVISAEAMEKKHHLLITGGSDFHGMIKPNIRIGGVDMLYMEDMLAAQLLDALGMTASS